MKTIIFEIASLEDAFAQIIDAAQAGMPEKEARYSFPTVADMARTLTPTRWGILQALTGAGPLGVRELARRVGRDVKGVHTDARALALCGVIDRTGDGKYVFPYEAVHVDFMLKAA
ncbi:MAG: DNA-binding protein [Azoarcus sp.]|jgi:predicted transcriptional regulator|nr:DNA-binding protein [Azoarcus sp.]